MVRITVITGLILPTTILGCSPNGHRPARAVTVLAAASLDNVLHELADRFETAHARDVTISTGASGALCTQIELGTPCDVFLSADPALVDRLLAGGRAVAGSRYVLAHNRLVIAVTAPPAPRPPWTSAEALTDLSRIAIADPDSAPAGRYAEEALQASHLWDRLAPKLVRAGDVRSAARLLAMRTVDAAIVYETDVAATGGVTTAYIFPAAVHAPIEYVGVLIEPHDTGSRAPQAAEFLAFLQSDAARAIWSKHGFVTTPNPPKAPDQTGTDTP